MRKSIVLRDGYGNALHPADIAALHALRCVLDEPEAAQVRARHEANRSRNARLRAHNLRRSLVAKGVIKTVSA